MTQLFDHFTNDDAADYLLKEIRRARFKLWAIEHPHKAKLLGIYPYHWMGIEGYIRLWEAHLCQRLEDVRDAERQ